MKYNLIEIDNNNLLEYENKIIIFNFNNYFDFLLKGYNNNYEIENQFILDSKRNNIRYNSFLIKDVDRFNSFLKKKYNYNLLKKIYIISSQTLFSYIYKLFVDVLPENYYLCELNNKVNNNIKQIKIFFNNYDSLNIHIYKCMKIFNFDEKKGDKDIIYIVFIYNIDLEKDKFIHCSIKYFKDINFLIKFYKSI